MTRRAVFLAVALMLVVSPLVGTAVSIAGAQEGGGNASYSYSELAERGQRIEGADPSRRWFGDSGSIYVSYQQTNLVKEMASKRPKWAVDKVVSPDKVVDTNEVKLHINRGQSAESKTVHVVVIAWRARTPEANSTNATAGARQPVVYDVRRQVTEVKLDGSFETVTVGLPDTQKAQRVTMFVQEYPNARWVFPHDPVATADALPFGNSWGSYLPWFASRFGLITALGVPIAIAGAYKTLDVTHTGPGKGVIWWMIAGGLGIYVALYFAHRAVASVLTTAPWVMGVTVVGIAYVATLELADPTEEGRFESIVTTDAQNPLGEDIPDIAEEWAEHLSYVELDDGRIAFVKNSLSYFATLLAGAEPPTLDVQDLNTRVRSRGSSPEDEKFYGEADDYVPDDGDEEKPELVWIRWPAIEFGPDGLKERVTRKALPSGEDQDREDVEEYDQVVERWDRDKLTRAGLGGLLLGAATSVVASGLGLAILGFGVGFLLGTVRRLDGAAEFQSAPAHSTAAKARVITEKQELTVAQTFEEMQDLVAQADATSTEQAVDIAEAYIAKFREQMDRLIGGDAGGLPSAGSNGARVEKEVGDD